MPVEMMEFALCKGFNTVNMPKGATVLSAAPRYGHVSLWVSVDLSQDLESRVFHVVTAGEPFDPSAVYLETVDYGSSEHTLHVFEIPVISNDTEVSLEDFI